jgi:NADPH-dependent 2,4-dienoyl-CoA reductase/sulfur reductase-like enzyme
MTFRYLIVGGGMTADAAAKAIRASDATGTIGLVSAEADAPYKRPPLSKGLWSGSTVERTDLGTHKTGAVMLLGRTVTALDVDARVARLDDGSSVSFEYLLLATGASARTLPSLPVGGPIVAYRTLADFRAAHQRAVPGARVLVVGGGFIGSELAAGLSRTGAEVHMVFPEPAMGASRFPARLAASITADYRAHGVLVYPDNGVRSAVVADDAVSVVLNDGTELSVDMVAVGVGTAPNVDLAAAAGLVTGNGVVVDSRLRTQRVAPDGENRPVEHVFAAGDVASFPWASPLQPGRIEHEDNAMMMGAHAGRQLAAAHRAATEGSSGSAAGTPYLHLPFFYSDLFDNGYEAVGVLDSRLVMVEDWHDGLKAGIIYYLDDHKVVGVLLWNTWGLVDAAREVVAADARVEPELLRGRLRP